MKTSRRKIILYSSILFLLPIYSFIRSVPSSASLIGTKWYFYKEYSNPCCGGHGWVKVSDADSKKYFELNKNGEVEGNFFYPKYYLMKDSSNFELLDSNKKVVEPYLGTYSCNINNDTLILGYICKEGCELMFVKRD